MLGAVAASANEVYGALLAVAKPATLGRAAVGRAGASTGVAAAESPRALGGKSELSDEETREIEELEKRDREVRRHEQAHQSAAGAYSRGGPTFKYETGPNGKQYATEGEVSIDTSEVSGDPKATIRKMQTIRRAATAPADPSPQDRRVAAEAAQTEAKARAEVARGLEASGGEAQPAHHLRTGASQAEESGGQLAPTPTALPNAVAAIQGGALAGRVLDSPGRWIDVHA